MKLDRPSIGSWCQIGHPANAEILAVDGVDGVFIGPYDMSGSYGVPGQTAHETVVRACQTVAEACQRHKKAAGQHIVVPSSENVKQALAQGYTLLALGMDTVFLAQGAQTARNLIDQPSQQSTAGLPARASDASPTPNAPGKTTP